MDSSNFVYRAFEKDDPATLYSRYAPPVLSSVAERLLAGRSLSGNTHEQLAELCAESLINATLIDRHLKALPRSSCLLLSILAKTQVGVWQTSEILTLQQIFFQTVDPNTITQWLQLGLAVPTAGKDSVSIEDGIDAGILIFPQVLERSLLHKLDKTILVSQSPPKSVQTGDGFEWLLRLGYAWQKLQANPARVTNSGSLFKKDYQRLQADTVLGSPISQPHVEAPDLGIFTLQLGLQIGLFRIENDLLLASAWPECLIDSAERVLRTFWAVSGSMRNWSPVTGDAFNPSAVSFGNVVVALMIALETVPEHEMVSLQQLLEWLELRHPHWNIPKNESEKWLEQALEVWGVTLGMIEMSLGSEKKDRLYRLSSRGRACLNRNSWREPTQVLPQCLVVQPNGEMIIYRQGLTPKLHHELTLMANWKNIGSVCTLELTSESVYRGLEAGLTSSEISRILQAHSTQTLPSNLVTSIQQWAGRRERILVFSSANILEFHSSIDRDEAFQRGLISIKIGERLGVSLDKELPYQHFRLLGNRDYESKPQQCISFEEDGVTFSVDVHTSDLLLEGELNRLADPLSSNENKRKYRLNPQKLRQALEHGLSRTELEQWFADRTGQAPTAAARFLATNHQGVQTTLQQVLVISLPSEIADGLTQWPESKRFIRERLGQNHLSIANEHLPEFLELLSQFGITVKPNQ